MIDTNDIFKEIKHFNMNPQQIKDQLTKKHFVVWWVKQQNKILELGVHSPVPDSITPNVPSLTTPATSSGAETTASVARHVPNSSGQRVRLSSEARCDFNDQFEESLGTSCVIPSEARSRSAISLTSSQSPGGSASNVLPSDRALERSTLTSASNLQRDESTSQNFGRPSTSYRPNRKKSSINRVRSTGQQDITSSIANLDLASSTFESYLASSPAGPYLDSLPAGPYLASSPAGPYIASSPAGPYLASSPAGPYLASSPAGPYLARSPAGPYLARSPAGPYLASSPAGHYSNYLTLTHNPAYSSNDQIDTTPTVIRGPVHSRVIQDPDYSTVNPVPYYSTMNNDRSTLVRDPFCTKSDYQPSPSTSQTNIYSTISGDPIRPTIPNQIYGPTHGYSPAPNSMSLSNIRGPQPIRLYGSRSSNRGRSARHYFCSPSFPIRNRLTYPGLSASHVHPPGRFPGHSSMMQESVHVLSGLNDSNLARRQVPAHSIDHSSKTHVHRHPPEYDFSSQPSADNAHCRTPVEAMEHPQSQITVPSSLNTTVHYYNPVTTREHVLNPSATTFVPSTFRTTVYVPTSSLSSNALGISQSCHVSMSEQEQIPVSETDKALVSETDKALVSETESALVSETETALVSEAEDIPIPEAEDIPMPEAEDIPMPEAEDIPVTEADLSLLEVSSLLLSEMDNVPVSEADKC